MSLRRALPDRALSRRSSAPRRSGGMRRSTCSEVARCDVTQARRKVREEPVARGDDQQHGKRSLAELLRVFAIQVALEVARKARGNPALATAIHEVQRSAVRHQHAKKAPLEQSVEVAGARLVRLREDEPASARRVGGALLGTGGR